MFATLPALAKVDTVCQGRGVNGGTQTVEIKHWDSRPGSKIQALKMNGYQSSGTYEGRQDDVLSFSINGNSKSFSFDYDVMAATAQLSGPGFELELFCSRH